ncbi:activator-dependent family glycosyltransferase, partial [Streptosporangium sandarakinum]
MRVLVTCWAWSSHYLPLVPLVQALRAAGHEVCVASQDSMAGVVTGSGAAFVAAGPDVDHAELRARHSRRSKETTGRAIAMYSMILFMV